MPHGVQQIQPAENIRLIIQLRLFDGLADKGCPGKMQYTVDGTFAENLCEIARVAEIAFERRSRFHKRSMAG